ALKAALTSWSEGAAPVPLDGAFHLSYDGSSRTASLANTFVRTPQTRVAINGAASQKLKLTVQAHAEDLREVNFVVAALQSADAHTSANTAPPGSVNLGGAADVQVFIEGSVSDPRIRGLINGQDLQVENTEWRSLELGFEANKSGVSIQNGSLVNAHQGYISFSGRSALADWHYLHSSPVSVDVMSRGLDIKELLQAAKLDYPVSGNLSVDVAMHD